VIKVGLVGYGFAGRGFHSYLINRVPELKLAAVAVRSPERRAQAERDHGVATFATVADLLARGGVDLVVLATPHDTHASLAIEAMSAGKHVVTDKVMCMNTREADAMIEASRRHHVLLSVFQNRRWDWDYLTVKKVLEDGLLGAPYLFEVAIMRNRPPRGWRATVEAGGGLLYDWGAHLIDQALQLVPSRIESVSCDLQYRGWGAEIGSYGRVQMRFEGGVLYDVEISNLAWADKPRWLILGERGALVKRGLDPQEMAMLRGDIGAATEDPANRAVICAELNGLTTEMTVESVRSDWTEYYRNVAASIRGEAELAVKPEEARRAVAVFDAAMESSRTGQTIRLGV